LVAFAHGWEGKQDIWGGDDVGESIYKKLSKLSFIDVRIFYLILLILIALPLLFPIGFPISISEGTREFHDYIENLPERSVILYEEDGDAGAFASIMAGAVATMNQLLMKKSKIVIICFVEDGPMLISNILKSVDQSLLADKKYGDDYVIFGFVPGEETAMAAFASNIYATVPKDIYGTPIEQIPMMNNIHSAKDITLTVSVITRCGWVDVVARQWGATWQTPLVLVVGGGCAPGAMPYKPKYIKALLWGTRGNAEYEILIGKLGEAASSIDSISLIFVLLIITMIIGNIGYFGMRMEEKRKMEEKNDNS
jgi:hypothetical protein